MNSTLLPWEEYERGSDVQYEEHQSSTHIEKSSDTKVLQEEPQHREFVASEHFTVNAPQLHRATKEHKALPKHGTLFIVSTPIGNNDDISLRALKTLKTADVVVGEEGKTAARLLHDNRISKKLEELNEHNEHEQTPRLLQLLKSGKTLALVSDAGTPLLADPGAQLVRKAIEAGISVRAVPGVTSIMAALTTSGLPMDSFVFAGFLSREPAERLQELKRLAQEPRTVVVLETPYRLVPLLEAARQIIPQRRAYLGCNLTMESETHHYGTVSELYTKFVVSRFKG
ncbi:MAG: 16S rRNA (cytidine(1402)-2'-O)-methyltransferase, partial [Candidatus Kapabacteria bacterium]|nr:16S rRNA (cytidine(1402)-2'-O)-methyltransferase [Candidatus Kapabacteria bacterium]